MFLYSFDAFQVTRANLHSLVKHSLAVIGFYYELHNLMCISSWFIIVFFSCIIAIYSKKRSISSSVMNPSRRA